MLTVKFCELTGLHVVNWHEDYDADNALYSSIVECTVCHRFVKIKRPERTTFGEVIFMKMLLNRPWIGFRAWEDKDDINRKKWVTSFGLEIPAKEDK